MGPNLSELLRAPSVYDRRGEWPSGPAIFISFTGVKHDCVRSETGWATFRMNDQNSSFRRPSEGALN